MDYTNLTHPLFLLPALTFGAFLIWIVYRWIRVRQKMK